MKILSSLDSLKNFQTIFALAWNCDLEVPLLTGLMNKNNDKDKSEQLHDKQCSLIIKNLLNGLHHIHDKHEMIHRDIKPSNILFLHKGDLKSLKI